MTATALPSQHPHDEGQPRPGATWSRAARTSALAALVLIVGLTAACGQDSFDNLRSTDDSSSTADLDDGYDLAPWQVPGDVSGDTGGEWSPNPVDPDRNDYLRYSTPCTDGSFACTIENSG